MVKYPALNEGALEKQTNVFLGKTDLFIVSLVPFIF